MQYKTVKMCEIDPALPHSETGSYVDMMLHVPQTDIGYGAEQRFPAVVLLPGGAYFFTSEREADPVALKFFAAGYQVFTVRYSVSPDRYPTALLEVMAMIKHIRNNAAAYSVIEDKIAVCGFSAGGHLAASSGILWKEPVVSETLGVDGCYCRPDRMILCYPVITSGEFAHRQSFEMLLGEDAGEEMVKSMSLETRVDADTAPAFLWHTFSDELVPVENSLLMATALRKNNVPFEMHIFPDGIHGLSLADNLTWTNGNDKLVQPHVSAWMPLCIRWLDEQFGNNMSGR